VRERENKKKGKSLGDVPRFEDNCVTYVTWAYKKKDRRGTESRGGAGALASITWCFYGRSLMCWRLMKKQQLGLRTGVISFLLFFFYILYLKRKRKMLFMFLAFLIRVIWWTQVLRAFRSPWLHFVRIRSKLLYTAAFLILGPTIKEEEVKTL